MDNLLIGTDPELFLYNTKTKKYVSAHDVIPGTKSNPHLVDRGAVQVDGIAAEFNTFPAPTKQAFINNHEIVLGHLDKMVKDHDENLILVPTPTVSFDEDYWDSLPMEAKILGCEPDFSAYTGKTNPKPSVSKPIRTGGFHIHVGWGSRMSPKKPEHMKTCMAVAKQLDAAIYGVSTLWDSDNSRRAMYGELGSFRPKVYGMEWRPLSNAVLQNQEILEWVYDATVHAVSLLFDEDVQLEYQNLSNPIEAHEYLIAQYGMPPAPDFLFGEDYKGESVNDVSNDLAKAA